MNNKTGITLVALIITIIILLVLATVSISLVMNTGIIGKAEHGVDKYSEEEIYEQIKLVYSEAQTAKFTDTNFIIDEYIKNSLEKIYGEGKVNVDGRKIITIHITNNDKNYEYIIKENGDIIKPTQWTDNGDETYTKGDVTLKIGDYINYKAPESLGYTGGWRVLGFEDGQIKLMSSEKVCTLTLIGRDGYNTGISQLNSICEKYADGAYSNYARSIKMDDICGLSGYDKTTWTESSYPSYGDTITYKVTDDGVQYKKGDEEYVTDTSIKKFVKPDGTELAKDEEISITSNYFGRTTMGLNRKSVKSQMIFIGEGTDAYYTADQYILPVLNNGYVRWGIMFVSYAGRNI